MLFHGASSGTGTVALLVILLLLLPATGLFADLRSTVESPSPATPSSTSAPADVRLSHVGSALWGATHAVTAAGDYAFVAMAGGIEILNVSIPAVPVVVSRVPTATPDVRALAVSGDLLLFEDAGWFHVVDVSDLDSPVEVGTCPIPRYSGIYFFDIAVLDDAVYLASYGVGVSVVSIADPSMPILESTIPPQNPRAVELVDSLLLVSAFDGLRTFSLADPHQPQLLGHWLWYAEAANDLASNHGYAYMTGPPRGPLVIDVGQPASPMKVADFDAAGGSLRCDVQGNLLFLVAGFAGLTIADLSNPVVPVIIGSLGSDGYATQVTAKGDIAFVVDDETGVPLAHTGLQIVDLSDPAIPSLLTKRFGAGFSGDVAVAGTLAFVANDGLRVVSLDNPDVPEQIGALKLHDWIATWAVAYEADRVYVADYDAVPGVRIISVADPTTPTSLGFYNTYTDPNSLVARGKLLYIADGNLRIADVSDPAAPTPVAGLVTPGASQEVWLDGDYAYLADGDAGLLIVDIADPYAPRIVGTLDSPGFATGVCVSGTRAYVADGPLGLLIVDVSNPALPVLLGWRDTPGHARRVKVTGDFAIVADQLGGLQVMDVSEPTAPSLYTAAAYKRQTNARNVIVDGDRLVVAAGGQLLVLSLIVGTGAYMTGDVNADATITSADIVYLANYVFKGGPQPLVDYRAGDADCSGAVTSADLISLVNHVFKGGAAPGCP